MMLSVVMFSVLSIMILNPFTSEASSLPMTNVNLVGYISTSLPDTIIVEHRGGDTLNHYTITFFVGTVNVTKTEQDPGPQEWSIGERWVYTSPTSLAYKKVSVLVIDTSGSSTVIYNKVIQNISDCLTPFAQTIDPYQDAGGVTATSAQLGMYYNFVSYGYYQNPTAGKIYFSYQKIDAQGTPITGIQNTSAFTPLPLDGYYRVPLQNLTSGARYQFRAVIKWGSSTNYSSFFRFWTYNNTRGLWHLNEGMNGSNALTAVDSAHPPSNATNNGASFIYDNPHNNGYVSFNSATQSLTVPNHHKFDLPDAITVREWIYPKPGGSSFFGNLSEISNTSLSSLSTKWIEPSVINIQGNVYAAVYRTATANGSMVTTFYVPPSGVIPQPFQIIDTETFTVGNYRYHPEILYAYNDIYVVSYGSRSYDTTPGGNITTLSISPTGQIGTMIDYVNTVFFGNESKLFSVSGNIYGVVYGGDYSEMNQKKTGGIITFTVNSQGYLSVLYTKKFSEKYCSKVDIALVAPYVYAVAYDDDTNQTGIVQTVRINGTNGQVTMLKKVSLNLIKYMEPDIVAGDLPDLFVIAYGGDSQHPLQGQLEMVLITSNGTQVNFSGNLLFPTSLAIEPEIDFVSQNTYFVTYSEGSSTAKCYCFTARVTDHIEYRDYQLFKGRSSALLRGLTSSLVKITPAGDHFLLVYGSSSGSSAGFVATVNINLVSASQIAIKKGDMFQFEVADVVVTATIKTSNMFYSVSGTLTVGKWNHVVLTYGSSILRLYINKVSSTPVSCVGSLVVNTNPLVFGNGFYGYLDEIGVYAQAWDSGGVSNDFTSTNRYS